MHPRVEPLGTTIPMDLLLVAVSVAEHPGTEVQRALPPEYVVRLLVVQAPVSPSQAGWRRQADEAGRQAELPRPAREACRDYRRGLPDDDRRILAGLRRDVGPVGVSWPAP